MFEFLSELTERTDSSRSSIGVLSSRCMRAPSAPRAVVRRRRPAPSECEPNSDEVLEVRLRQRGGVADRLFRRDRAVRLDRQREAIVVRALADAGLRDREVGATHRVVDRVDADEIDRQAAIERMLIGLDVAAALVHVQLDVEIAIVLQREEVMRADRRSRTPRSRVDVAGRDRRRAVALDVQHRVSRRRRRASA